MIFSNFNRKLCALLVKVTFVISHFIKVILTVHVKVYLLRKHPRKDNLYKTKKKLLHCIEVYEENFIFLYLYFILNQEILFFDI